MAIKITPSIIKVYSFLFILLLFGIIPFTITETFNLTSSSAPGLVFLMILLLPLIYRYAYILTSIKTKSFIISIIFIAYMLVQHLFVSIWLDRSYYSIALLVYTLSSAYLTSCLLHKIDMHIIVRTNSLLVFILFIWCFSTVFSDLYGSSLGPLGIFHLMGEPSHFALFSGIFFVNYFIFSDTFSKKIAIVFLVIALATLIPNTTMLFFPLLMILLIIKLTLKNIIVLSLAIFSVYQVVISSEYFSNRIYISSDSTNLSSLVYLQGVLYAKKALIDTFGLGLGFQMMGTQETLAISKTIISYLGAPNSKGLNRLDGSFLAAKIVAEFGVLGILLLIFYIIHFFKALIYLRRLTSKSSKFSGFSSSVFVLSQSMILSFSVYLFIRGMGYFNQNFFIFLVAIFISYQFGHKSVAARMHV